MKTQISCNTLSAVMIALLLTNQSIDAFAEGSNPTDGTPYSVPQTSRKVHIDGVLDDPAWSDALVLELKYEIDPGENIEPPVRTFVYLTNDKGNLYVAFKCYDDDIATIRAHLTDRDRCLDDDYVNISIDTFNDERRSFTIGANALGVQIDAHSNGDSFDRSWDAIFDSAGKVYNWGYAVELAIPFNQLQFQRTDGPQIWGFDALRIYPRSTYHTLAIVPRDRNNNCYQCQMIKLQGFAGASPGRNIEIIPTVTAVRTDAREDLPGDDFTTIHKDAEAGLTASWGITPNITAGGTLNPDFSQVEADAAQLDINQPFALYYSEKRPFFLEGRDIFNSPQINAIYTRTMRDPIWGAKIAGKEGVNSIGFFVVEDNITNLIFPYSRHSSSTSLDKRSTAFMGRYKRDFSNKYTFGALFTGRQGNNYHNQVYGFDGKFRFTNTDSISVQVLGSSTGYPDDIATQFDQPFGNFNGYAYEAYYSHRTRNYYFQLNTDNFSSNFRADLGFVPQVDYRLYNGSIGYTFLPKEPTWYTAIGFSTSFQYWEDQDGNLINRRTDITGTYQGPMQIFSYFRYYRSQEVYNDELFTITHLNTYAGIIPNRYVNIGLSVMSGSRIDYANSRLGKRIALRPSLNWRPQDNLSIDFSHYFEQLSIGQERLYTANVSQGTIVYQFNTRTFIRSILQYVNYDYNVGLYTFEVDPNYKHLFTQFLFSYKINPRTVLFIGYTDNYFGDQRINLTQTDRTLFFKIGYAWQL